MAEYVRSVEIVATIDTNKQTIEHRVEADSLEAALTALRELVGTPEPA